VQLQVVTARGTDYKLLEGAPFVASDFDIQQHVINRGLQVKIINPQGQLVDWIDKSVPGIYLVSFRSLASGEELGTLQVHVIYDYVFSGFLPPIRTDREYYVQQNSSVPIKFTFTDKQGMPVSDIPVKVYIAPVVNGIVGDEVPAVSKGGANMDNMARYDFEENQYIFNLSTHPLEQGTYQVRAFFGDATSQTFILVVR
jgi:hypothetical protein